jgi:hypothetical protein
MIASHEFTWQLNRAKAETLCPFRKTTTGGTFIASVCGYRSHFDFIPELLDAWITSGQN